MAGAFLDTQAGFVFGISVYNNELMQSYFGYANRAHFH